MREIARETGRPERCRRLIFSALPPELQKSPGLTDRNRLSLAYAQEHSSSMEVANAQSALALPAPAGDSRVARRGAPSRNACLPDRVKDSVVADRLQHPPKGQRHGPDLAHHPAGVVGTYARTRRPTEPSQRGRPSRAAPRCSGVATRVGVPARVWWRVGAPAARVRQPT